MILDYSPVPSDHGSPYEMEARGSKAEKGDLMKEAEVQGTHSEGEGRGHKPRNSGDL